MANYFCLLKDQQAHEYFKGKFKELNTLQFTYGV